MRIKKNNTPIVIAVVFLIIIIIILMTSNKNKQVNYEELTEEEQAIMVTKEIKEMETSKLSTMGERDRMEYYVSTFIKEVEKGNYEGAYDMLYDDFKSNFFPTLESFETYAKNKFPRMISLKHINFERNGEYYILWVTMSNSLGSKDSSIEMNFVIKENNLNDFEMSFSVI